MTESIAETEALLVQAEHGDDDAANRLLQLHRKRLRQMVSVRLDHRIRGRIDPSDVVQEALVQATRQLPDYLRERPVAFYPWLRRIAWEQLVHLHDRHLRAQKRSIHREAHSAPALPDQSVAQLVDRLVTDGTSPSRHMIRKEMRERVREALDQMESHDREVLVLWYLEQLAVPEIAEILELSESGVKSRHRRALMRLTTVLAPNSGEN